MLFNNTSIANSIGLTIAHKNSFFPQESCFLILRRFSNWLLSTIDQNQAKVTKVIRISGPEFSHPDKVGWVGIRRWWSIIWPWARERLRNVGWVGEYPKNLNQHLGETTFRLGSNENGMLYNIPPVEILEQGFILHSMPTCASRIWNIWNVIFITSSVASSCKKQISKMGRDWT